MTRAEIARLLARKRLLIFDLDGTLVDSSPIHARAFDEAFSRYGVMVDYSRIAGMTTKGAVAQLALEKGLDLDANALSDLATAKSAAAARLSEDELRPIEGSVGCVALASGRFDLALASSGSRPSVEAALRAIGLAGVFSPIVTAEDVERGKPDPESYRRVLELRRVDPAGALVFEDADAGLAAAAAAGIEAIRIVRPGDPHPDGTGWEAVRGALESLAP